MSIGTEVFSFDRDDLISQLGFSSEDSKLLSNHADDIIKAILAIEPEVEAEDRHKQAKASATAPLFTPGKRYHLNLTTASNEILTGATRIVVLACILNKLRILDLTVAITDMALTRLLRSFTKLNERQRKMIEAIYQLKRVNRSPAYWPSTGEIASRLSVSESEVTVELTSLDGKVAKLDKENGTWRVLF